MMIPFFKSKLKIDFLFILFLDITFLAIALQVTKNQDRLGSWYVGTINTGY